MQTEPDATDLATEAAERRTRHIALAQLIQDTAVELLDIARDRAAQSSKPGEKHPDHTLAASRAAAMLERGINLEARIAAGVQTPARAHRAAAPKPVHRPRHDPRRALLREPLVDSVKAERAPGQAARLREIDEAIDEQLEADPNAERSMEYLLTTIADKLGIHIDVRKLRDEVLGMPPRKPLPEYIPDNTLPVLPLEPHLR